MNYEDHRSDDHAATYSPEDDKIRLYTGYVDRELFDALRAAGFSVTSKQDCDFAAAWTPRRVDIALALIPEGDDIGDEGYSPAERSADRAERFGGYRDKRRDDAHGLADRHDAGPSVVGHQSARKAGRAAARRDRLGARACSQWSKAEYWQQRTAGVIAHRLYLERPDVRRRRIKKLEGEQRKVMKSQGEAVGYWKGWQQVAVMEGADVLLPLNDSGYVDVAKCNAAGRLAYGLANRGHFRIHLYHPTSEEANKQAQEIWRHGFGAYDFLTDNDFCGLPFERFTPKRYADYLLENTSDPAHAEAYLSRWAAHFEMRLEYERAMLAEEGGSADDAEIVAGGFILLNGEMGRWLAEEAPKGWAQIHRVHKSRATGKASSVEVMGFYGRHCAGIDGIQEKMVKVNISDFAADRYRAPTPEELAEFEAAKKEAKAAAKKSKPKAPSLINPTDEDAERLQQIWNERAYDKWKAKHDAHETLSDEPPRSEVVRMTQAQYSARSKGSYASCETRTLHCHGYEARPKTNMYSEGGQAYDKKIGEPLCKIRRTGAADGGGRGWWAADRVIVITDKKQKPLPAEVFAAEPVETVVG